MLLVTVAGLSFWVSKTGVAITSSFAVTLDLAKKKPRETMKMYLPKGTVTDIYWGFVYIADGRKWIKL
jgi:hypothetical protein